MVLEMVGGPMAGCIHEVAEDVAIPCYIGLMKCGVRHWYEVNAPAGVALYSHSDRDVEGPTQLEMFRAENKAMMRELQWWRCPKCKLPRPSILKGDMEECKICAARRRN